MNLSLFMKKRGLRYDRSNSVKCSLNKSISSLHWSSNYKTFMVRWGYLKTKLPIDVVNYLKNQWVENEKF